MGNILKGKFTNISAVLLIVYAIIGAFLGQTSPDFGVTPSMPDTVMLIGLGATALGLRRAVKNEGSGGGHNFN